MHKPPVWRAIAIALLVIAAAVAIGAGAYNAGVAHGLAESGRAVAVQPSPGAQPVDGWAPWGHGFGFFPGPFLFLLLLIFVVRGLFWRGPWHGGCGHRHGSVPPGFDEWHRRAHAQPPPGSGEGAPAAQR